eukprot:3844660-Prymnesium_polylepis.1
MVEEECSYSALPGAPIQLICGNPEEVPTAMGGHLPVVAALLAAGADGQAASKNGTAFDAAEYFEHADVVEALRKAAALSTN